MLNLFEDRGAGRVSASDVVEILDIIENFIVRRYVCGTIRAELNELFTALHRNATRFARLPEGVREVLASRNYPSDEEFFGSIQTRKLYGAGEVRDRAKFILERLERAQSEKEHVETSSLSIEHIMPQTLTEWWRTQLGTSAEETHELYLHTIGNLTLTGYNSELSNADFPRKRELLSQSRLALNAKLAERESWNREEIESRGRALAEQAVRVWGDFSPEGAARRSLTVRGTSPHRLVVLGQAFEVQTWQDVLRLTLQQITTLGDDVTTQLMEEFPRHVSKSTVRARPAPS
ncbi:MAG: HNH endonuclease [Deltaproteobacteria bacterium]|nr:HNH endonuclease [Deltaproteobacteria bacterium]